ncbi:xanthine dehydrogenase/oxidase [Orussus abietinus]|uniref:xanthine dehydrogenase/oxidase n=1 Tax=Orussus abietinus TaxID=222816 RepID=UPI000626509E|nr:xanthine dehydrogenase/oxidase [Orussus abietinus]
MGTCVDNVGDIKAEVRLTINGKPYTVAGEIPPGTTLNTFIRENAKLKGTKAMCLEGGCGACIVAAEINGEILAVNSCLVPIFNCNGWAIKTIEGIGGKKLKYHPIQATLAEMNGSQCGFCSPGMVMNMYSLLQREGITMKEVENSFGSNICRCTGYRPILDAFKSFAKDAHPTMKKNIQDIEELYRLNICPKTQEPCTGTCENSRYIDSTQPIHIKLKNAEFYKTSTIQGLFDILAKHPNSTYVLNGGNTAHGVYRLEKPEIYVDINDIPDLHRVEKDSSSLVLGANVTLTDAMKNFEKFSKDQGFEYLQHLAKHIDLVASVAIRNIGTIAGNLMIKHRHREFPSDLFLLLETAGAQLHVLENPSSKCNMTFLEFLKTKMERKVIYSVVLPAMSKEYEFRSYKIMPRAQNAHALVNAGFLFKLNGSGTLLEKPNIIIGGINPDFLHASKTENFLIGKSILNKTVFKDAMNILDSELNPDHVLPDASPNFRKLLAEGLFYKFVLSLKPENVDSKIRSGGTLLDRGLSSGKQDYDTDRNIWPLNKPIPKMESIYQTSGEAQYINDVPPQPNEVYCAFVLVDVPNGKIESIDAQEALEMDGVEAFFTYKDFPGKNLFISAVMQLPLLMCDEPVLAEEEILFNGQPLGIIAARTHTLANEAAKKVKIIYSDVMKNKPIITNRDAINSGDKSRILQTANFPAKSRGNNTKHVIKGEFECGSQYHFTMETQSCVCIPVEDGMDVYPASQWMDLTQISIANCLDIRNNSINICVRRIGGGYGAKISRATQIACACALVCHKLNRPARFVMSIESNMMAIGKRYSTLQQYDVEVDEDGKIQYLNSKHWGNAGSCFNEVHAQSVISHFYSCYNNETWNCEGSEAKTDLPSNTYCRAPGSTEGTAMAENIMEHIGRTVSKDPLDVRMANMNEEDKAVLQPMIEDLKKSADYEARKKAVNVFNEENRWKKKGLSLVLMNYSFMYWGEFNAMVAIYARDGTVSVSHGGIECGQGIHTKIAQVAAHTLGIDLDMISVKPSNNLVSPNNSVTGGSVTSECCAYATLMACKELLSRLEPIKKEMKNPTWKELVLAAHLKDVNLCARYMFTSQDNVKNYGIYGVTIAEVEVDILTGQYVIQRVDLMEDVGISMNPEIDLGQVEGAFVMGIGYWTSEELIYDPDTALLTNHRTWNYKPPGAKDIPVDFRVSFRRNAPNPVGVLRSKATGEPPLCMSCAIPIAIRAALNSARADSGNEDTWYPLDGPVTTEKILLSSLTDRQQMTF